MVGPDVGLGLWQGLELGLGLGHMPTAAHILYMVHFASARLHLLPPAFPSADSSSSGSRVLASAPGPSSRSRLLAWLEGEQHVGLLDLPLTPSSPEPRAGLEACSDPFPEPALDPHA